MLLGFAASFAPNRSTSADLTAFFSSSGFTQCACNVGVGVFFSTEMATPMFTHPVTARDLTYSATALEGASAVIVDPVWSRNGGVTRSN